MKTVILFSALVFASSANAQSLKDALFGGKLKNDTGSLVKKTDDLSAKIDTSQKKRMEVERARLGILPGDSVAKKQTITPGTAANPSATPISNSVDGKSSNAGPKDNTKAWKEFMDSSVSIFKTEVIPNKKIKSGTYYVFVEYEIGTDGQVTISNVTVSPESSYLQEQVKERLLLTAPQLSPVLSSAGKPVKSKRRYNFNITKS
jgi:hypothetical protein